MGKRGAMRRQGEGETETGRAPRDGRVGLGRVVCHVGSGVCTEVGTRLPDVRHTPSAVYEIPVGGAQHSQSASLLTPTFPPRQRPSRPDGVLGRGPVPYHRLLCIRDGAPLYVTAAYA